MLDEIKKGLKGIAGIDAVILFGSHARGEADKRSDIDLCVILKKPNKKIENVVSEKSLDLEKQLKQNIQVVFADQQFSGLDRNLVETILREGKLLFGKIPATSIQLLQLEPFVLIKYGLSNLSQSKKMKLRGILYGKTSKKKYKGKEYVSKMRGLVAELGAERTGIASIMVKQNSAAKIEEALEKEGAKVRKTPIWVPKK